MAEKQKTFLPKKILPKTLFLMTGIPQGSFGSIDITNRCNLRCKHCYFYEQDVPEELSDKQWIEKFEILTKGVLGKMRSATWIGGEPLLRKDLIELGKKYFTHNLIVTNGLIPLPNWTDVQFHISLDGDEEAHEKMRNQKGIYKQIMKNANRTELNITMAYCISSLNIDRVEKVLKEWKDVGIRGFLFSFYTPIESIKDPLFPEWEARDLVIDRILELKASQYGDYIHIDAGVLELMKQKNSKSVTDNCLFMTKGISLDPLGNKKAKCMMGDKADCDRCGCIVPYYLAWQSDRKKILQDLYQDLSGYMSSRVRHLFSSAPQ